MVFRIFEAKFPGNFPLRGAWTMKSSEMLANGMQELRSELTVTSKRGIDCGEMHMVVEVIVITSSNR